MADDIDRTQDRIELEEAIRRKYTATQVTTTHTGFCANCGEPVEPKLRWCNAECRDDWEHRTK
jgi:hypothetical protein